VTLNGWQRLFVAYLVFVHLPATGLIAYSEFEDARWDSDVEQEVLERLPEATVNLLKSGRLTTVGIEGCLGGSIRIAGIDAIPRLPSDICFMLGPDNKDPQNPSSLPEDLPVATQAEIIPSGIRVRKVP